MNYFQFEFEVHDTEQTDLLIALLGEIGFDGFEEENNLLKAFIPEEKFDASLFDSEMQKFDELIYNRSIIENINWNKQWEESFDPVVVDSFVAVRAHFHQPILAVAHEIIITPKMSFGTGHHATTYMVLEMMKGLDFKGKKVIDFGTGTGVLAILAEKLGSSHIDAIDNDEWSINNTRENIQQNQCSKIEVAIGSSMPPGRQYDIIIANINLNIILAHLESIVASATPGARIILSGFLISDEQAIESALIQNGLVFHAAVQKGEWLAVLAYNKT